MAELAARWRADDYFSADEWDQIKHAVSVAKDLKYHAWMRRREAKIAKREHRDRMFLWLIGSDPNKFYDDEQQMLSLAKQGKRLKIDVSAVVWPPKRP